MLRVPFFFCFPSAPGGFFSFTLSLSRFFSSFLFRCVLCVRGVPSFLGSLVPSSFGGDSCCSRGRFGSCVRNNSAKRNETKRNDMRVYVRATSTSAKIQKQKHQLTSKDRKQVSKQASGISKPVSPVSLQEEEKKEKKKKKSVSSSTHSGEVGERRKEEKEGGVVVVGGWLCGVCARKGSAIRLLVSPPGR